MTEWHGAQALNASRTSSGAAWPASHAFVHTDNETLGHHMMHVSVIASPRPGRPTARRVWRAYRGDMPAALMWLLFALGLAAAEALTGDMFLLMLSGGALAAAGSHWLLGGPVWVDGVVFLVVSVLLVAGVRPMLRRRLTVGNGLPEPAKALEGKHALVLDRVDQHRGQVKLDGEVWTARSYADDDVYQPGEQVTVMHIDGATAVVWRTP